MLHIQSSENTRLTISVDDRSKVIEYSSPRDQDILKAVEGFLVELNLSLRDISQIQVATGPGTFTSLRAGVSVAQALSLALNIPINHQKPGSSIDAQYGKLPNITESTK